MIALKNKILKLSGWKDSIGSVGIVRVVLSVSVGSMGSVGCKDGVGSISSHGG